MIIVFSNLIWLKWFKHKSSGSGLDDHKLRRELPQFDLFSVCIEDNCVFVQNRQTASDQEEKILSAAHLNNWVFLPTCENVIFLLWIPAQSDRLILWICLLSLLFCSWWCCGVLQMKKVPKLLNFHVLDATLTVLSSKLLEKSGIVGPSPLNTGFSSVRDCRHQTWITVWMDRRDGASSRRTEWGNLQGHLCVFGPWRNKRTRKV